MDLGGDNPGPLAEPSNLDKGLWVSLSIEAMPDIDNDKVEGSS